MLHVLSKDKLHITQTQQQINHSYKFNQISHKEAHNVTLTSQLQINLVTQLLEDKLPSLVSMLKKIYPN